MSAKRNNSPAVEQPIESAVSAAQDAANAAPALLEPMTLEAVRRELKGVKGKKYWRSLDELANT
jgi:molybdopterin-containing oxidoreductase family iron-sulfur binding subunit